MENEELLLRNTFLNARMGPLVEYNHNGYPNKSKLRGKLVWADEKRIPLTHEGPEEFDLINKINVESVVIHHHVESSQLKSSLSTSKRVPFGPKYTGEGKVDFYNQNDQRQTNEEMKETSSYESDMVAQPPQRAKFVPVSNTRCNDLNSYNKNQPPRNQNKTESNMQPSYQRQVLGQADMNSHSGPMMPRPYYHNDNHEMIDANPPQNTKANNGFVMHDEMDSRNEIFTKSSTDPTFKERKPLSSLQAQMPLGGPQTAMSNKSKNMHAKINRGISPNQPPHSKMNNEENKKSYQPNHTSKNMSKDMDEPPRRSSSLKAKKEREKMAYNKPSPSSRSNNRGGSFVVPSNSSGIAKSDSRKSTKLSSSSQNIKSNYSKPSGTNGVSNTSGASSTNYNRFVPGYGNRNPGNSNFTTNPRLRKPTPSGAAVHNTMASFRSGPVKVVGETTPNNQNSHNPSISSSIRQKDASKRPSSASKATKKPTKIITKTSTRPGTASTRNSSNRPPSPGSRSMKSDLLFGSYNKHK
jgi:hypothetical protein